MPLRPVIVNVFTRDSYYLEKSKVHLKPSDQRTLLKTEKVTYGRWVKTGDDWLQYSTKYPELTPVRFVKDEIEVPKENGDNFQFD